MDMKTNEPAFREIDMETWPRREHYNYYRELIKCGYALTAKLDVTAALNFAHANHVKFYGAFVYAAAKTVNEMDEMRMMESSAGKPGIWQISHPVFTVFHPDDHTFSDLWTEFHNNKLTFCTSFDEVIATYGNNHGIKGRKDQPANFFCISCVPWLDYTGYATFSQGTPALFPIITFGQYKKEGSKICLPASLSISHAAADGYHSSMFFKRLQENLNNL